MKFYGIADAHGLESFNPVTFNVQSETLQIDPRELGFMSLRANANRHRHADVYQVDLSPVDARKVQDLLDKGEYAKALLKLKEKASAIALARGTGHNNEKSWNMIPNPDLDPYH
jgi:hypothetical protein